MRIHKQIAENVDMWESAEGVEFGISSVRRPARALILGVWLFGWGFAWIQVAREINRPNLPDEIFPLVWLAIWTIVGLVVAYKMLESLFGRETISVGPTDVRLSYKSLGIGRSRSYSLTELSRLRLATTVERPMRRRGLRRGALVFDYRGKPVFWGRSLKSTVAQQIIEAVTRRFPSLG